MAAIALHGDLLQPALQPAVLDSLQVGQFLHGFRRYEQRKAAVVLVDVDTDLGRAGYEFRFRTMLGLDRQELLQRLRADKGRSV